MRAGPNRTLQGRLFSTKVRQKRSCDMRDGRQEAPELRATTRRFPCGQFRRDQRARISDFTNRRVGKTAGRKALSPLGPRCHPQVLECVANTLFGGAPETEISLQFSNWRGGLQISFQARQCEQGVRRQPCTGLHGTDRPVEGGPGASCSRVR